MNMSVTWFGEFCSLKCGTYLSTILKHWGTTYKKTYYKSGSNMRRLMVFNPLNAKLNSICHLLALLEAYLILHVSRIRVKKIITVCSQNHVNIMGRICG
jgi:hypothetical protein